MITETVSGILLIGPCSCLNVARADNTFPVSNGMPRSKQLPKVTIATKAGAPKKTDISITEVYTSFFSQCISSFLNSMIFDKTISHP
ncbi:Os02g0288744 [Oryza sativa Japonica Group]|uniref:Os02g0288744 protein n=1 Tax=Oryza sativa subsp. japonica TaxID=39947 RepID=A0A0P0VHS6_ORYSJ|nr:hypothetical protein EE612_010530 [Oryza sativa]BAS78173.1 Os02g0288744 [Oryza sativa Japonica Group]